MGSAANHIITFNELTHIKQSYVWREEWMLPFESTWGIIEKFRFINSASAKDINQIYLKFGYLRFKFCRGELVENWNKHVKNNRY